MLITTLTLALMLTAPPPSVEAGAIELALNAACGFNQDCRARRNDEAKTAAATVLDACAPHMDRRHCLTLVATLAESRMMAYPTCSPERCRQLCGLEIYGT